MSTVVFFFFKQKTAYEMRISDWSSDVCSSDLLEQVILPTQAAAQTIADKVKGGTSLAAAAKSAGLAVAGLSDLSQQQYAEKSSDAVANAVFAAPRGGIAQIAKSPLGWHVVRVSNVTTPPAKPLAAAARTSGAPRRRVAVRVALGG